MNKTTTKLYNTKYTVEMTRTDGCLIFKLRKIDNGKITNISHLYCTHKEIYTLIKEQYVIVRDCNSFATLSIRNNQLNVEYYELDVNHYTSELKGNYHSIHLVYDKFLQFYYGDNASWQMISKEKIKRAIIKCYASNISQVKSNKALWNKFKIQLESLSTWQYDTINLYADNWNNASFYFITYIGEKSCMNGGIICHIDTDGKKYYSIHT